MPHELKLILPTVDNDGMPVAAVHDRLQDRLCDLAGGFTAVAGFGGWRNPSSGEITKEPCTIYTVACETRTIEDDVIIACLEAGWEAGQVSVYVVNGDGVPRALDVPVFEHRLKLLDVPTIEAHGTHDALHP